MSKGVAVRVGTYEMADLSGNEWSRLMREVVRCGGLGATSDYDILTRVDVQRLRFVPSLRVVHEARDWARRRAAFVGRVRGFTRV